MKKLVAAALLLAGVTSWGQSDSPRPLQYAVPTYLISLESGSASRDAFWASNLVTRGLSGWAIDSDSNEVFIVGGTNVVVYFNTNVLATSYTNELLHVGWTNVLFDTNIARTITIVGTNLNFNAHGLLVAPYPY